MDDAEAVGLAESRQHVAHARGGAVDRDVEGRAGQLPRGVHAREGRRPRPRRPPGGPSAAGAGGRRRSSARSSCRIFCSRSVSRISSWAARAKRSRTRGSPNASTTPRTSSGFADASSTTATVSSTPRCASTDCNVTASRCGRLCVGTTTAISVMTSRGASVRSGGDERQASPAGHPRRSAPAPSVPSGTDRRRAGPAAVLR